MWQTRPPRLLPQGVDGCKLSARGVLRWLVPHWLMGPGDSVDWSRSGGPGDETGQGLREPCPHSTLLTPETQMPRSMVTEMLKPALKHNY